MKIANRILRHLALVAIFISIGGLFLFGLLVVVSIFTDAETAMAVRAQLLISLLVVAFYLIRLVDASKED